MPTRTIAYVFTMVVMPIRILATFEVSAVQILANAFEIIVHTIDLELLIRAVAGSITVPFWTK